MTSSNDNFTRAVSRRYRDRGQRQENRAALRTNQIEGTYYFKREKNMLFSEVKRSPLLWFHNPLKSTLMCSCMIESTSVPPRKYLIIFGNRSQSSEFSENVGNDFLDFGQLLENRKSSESVRKSPQKRQEHSYLINRIVQDCLQKWNFSSPVQLDISRVSAANL